MIIIGLLLVIAAGIFGIDLIDKNRFNIRQIEVFGSTIGIHGSARLFILGAIVGAAIILGLALIAAGARRKGSRAASRRRERKESDATASEVESLRAENHSLREELAAGSREALRPGGSPVGGATVPATPEDQ